MSTNPNGLELDFISTPTPVQGFQKRREKKIREEKRGDDESGDEFTRNVDEEI